MNKAGSFGQAEMTPQALMTEDDAIDDEEERRAQIEFE